MVLSSQMSRPRTSGRPNMFARQRHRPRRGVTVLGILALVLASTYWFWWRDSSGNLANGSDIAETQNASVLDLSNPETTTDLAESNQFLPSSGRDDLQTQRTTFQPEENTSSPAAVNQPDDTLPAITMGGRASDNTEPDKPANSNRRAEATRNSQSQTPPDRNRNQSALPMGDDRVGADPAAEVQRLMASADDFRARGQLVEARQLFSNALQHPQVGRAALVIREELRKLNETLIFSPHIADNDPFVHRHVIGKGDRLIHLARDAKVDYRLLSRINNIADPGKIRLGQTIKIVEGPFHAVIDKSAYRLDLYLGNADELGRRIYIRSFAVGLGEFNSTPVGSWVVRRNSKTINPAWTNPRTGERFGADNPLNPIGEYWIGLEGIDANTSPMRGYGIHGTIDPSSIGRQASMGCVRMNNQDIALIYELLTSSGSTIITQR